MFTKGVHIRPKWRDMFTKGDAINKLPTRRRKTATTKMTVKNGLRMKYEITMKEKRFSFLPTRKKEKRKANPQTKICKRVKLT